MNILVLGEQMTLDAVNSIIPQSLLKTGLIGRGHSHNKTTPAGMYIIAALAVFLTAPVVKAQEKGSSQQNLEYTIKAAFLFNFVKFVDWPAIKEANNVPIIIGIIGKDPFGTAFDSVKDKQVKGRKTVIKSFKSYKDLEAAGTSNNVESADTIESLKKCHLLFICSSEKEKITEITALAQKNSILTVGETPDLLQSGGIIKFLMEDNKVRFEINLTASKQASLTIRSQLLRLAKRVIGEEPSDQTNK